MKFKYVNCKLGPILWPFTDNVFHADIAKGAQKEVGSSGNPVLSAGFVDIKDGIVTCHGKSDSLGIKSDPVSDSQRIAEMLGLKSFKDEIASWPAPLTASK